MKFNSSHQIFLSIYLLTVCCSSLVKQYFGDTSGYFIRLFRKNSVYCPPNIEVKYLPLNAKPHFGRLTTMLLCSKTVTSGLPAVQTSPPLKMCGALRIQKHDRNPKLLSNLSCISSENGQISTFKLEQWVSSLPKCLLSAVKRRGPHSPLSS